MASTHQLSRQHLVYSLDQTHAPALEIGPGDRVVLETYDARTGSIQRDEDLLEHPHPAGSNPATGPILVRGAEPGDALCVEIERIELAPQGFLAVKAGMGLLGHLAKGFATRMVQIEGDQVRFGDLRFPIRPMVGVIGTAPAGVGISTGMPGPHGGNMDNRYIAPGSKVYLPVNVPGALLGIGDVHGAMGDGRSPSSGWRSAPRSPPGWNCSRESACAGPWSRPLSTGSPPATTRTRPRPCAWLPRRWSS